MHCFSVVRNLLVLAATALALANHATADGCFAKPYSCYPNGDIPPTTPKDYQSLYQAYAALVWQDFLALNFPAGTDDQGDPTTEPSASLGLDAGNGYPAVWQQYSAARDTFLPKGVAPAAFGSGHVLPTACQALKAGPKRVFRKGKRAGAAGSTFADVLDEYVQANRMGPVIDKNGQYVRYGINFNKTMFNYIVTNNLFNKAGQAAFDAVTNNANRSLEGVQFPVGTYTAPPATPSNPGSIFVKTSWKVLGVGDDAAKFFTTNAYLYEQAGGAFGDEPTVKEACRVAPVGLVGMHVVHLTASAPQWVWATFEHVSNAPWMADFEIGTPVGAYSFYDATTCPSVAGKPSSSCKYNQHRDPPWNPQNSSRDDFRPIVRIAAPGSGALQQNSAFRAQLTTNMVWRNYFLTDVQFPTRTGPVTSTGTATVNAAYPDGLPSPSLLANSTLETHIQSFTKGDKTSNSNDIPLDDTMQNVNPGGPGVVQPFNANGTYNQAGGAHRVSSTCVGCHRDAGMTTGTFSHFVFSLNRAESPPSSKPPKQAPKAAKAASAAKQAK